MTPDTVEFVSEGDVIEAHLYLPKNASAPVPAVVLAGGWCYVKELVQPFYARALAQAGLAALVFDYRRLGGSEGTPRQHLDPSDQLEDYRTAISYLETRPEVDAASIGAWGISYSGGHVLILGATDPRVRAVVSVVPVIDGLPTLKQAHGTMGFRRLKEALLEGRRTRFATGEHTYLPHGSPDPAQEVVTWPFPSSHPTFAWLKETQAPRYENRATVLSTELLLAYSVYPHVTRLIDTPTLMIVAEGDDHTMWELEIEAFSKIPTPRKSLRIVPRSGHLGLYRDVDLIQQLADECAAWFATWLMAR